MKKFIKNIWDRITTNMPFRMAVGRFGMWLMKMGRTLQTRYANWNTEFRLKHEFQPNPDCCTLHVSERVTADYILTFEGLNYQKEKMTPMVKELLALKGVSKVTLQAYQIGIMKGRVFGWDEILPQVETVLIRHLVG